MRTITAANKSLVAIGAALREAREYAGFTQAQFAAKIKCSQAKISQWESGNRCPILRDLPRIAAALSVPPWTLAKKIFEKIQNSEQNSVDA